ncbi:MAG TPA: IPT/TIG domain-containing protein [Blastocatellia bacterium]|nr:IPT/TIG domain-containing protein [Blastocatellia bacterium]
MVATLTFGSAEGNANQSITRSPDISGGFVTHSTAPGSGGSLFSPGARVNGSPFTTTDPIVTSISPPGVVASEDPVTITVAGSNFVNGSTANINGAPVTTTFLGPQELSADIPLAFTSVPGNYAIAVRNPNGALSNAVQFVVLSRIGINEYLADPPDGQLGDANGDGVRDSAQDEFIEIVNRTSAPVDVSGFAVLDADATRFTFPTGAVIPAGEAAVIFGGGHPQGDFGNARSNGLVFTAALSLNNSGDTIVLKNASALPVETITYGATEGSANQSLNRNPDLVGIHFTAHSTVPGSGGRLFSPGTLVNGSPFSVGPRITSLNPDNAKRDAPPFDMTVAGGGFEGGATVLIDGQGVTTEFIASDRLIARVPSSVTAASGPHTVQVRNEGGNRSNTAVLTIVPPPPTILSILPRLVTVGGGAFPLFVSGFDFDTGPQVLIDDVPVSTTVISSSALRATVPPSFITTIGTRSVVVRNADGKKSNSAALDVIAAATTIASIFPVNTVAGGPSFSLSINGSNFKSNASVFFDAAELVVRVISQKELSAQVPQSLITKPGIHGVSVQNGNEFRSNEVLFQVLPDPPLLGSLDPASVTAGSGDLIITVQGQKFQPGAIIRVIETTQRGASLETSFLDSERLRARVPAALIERSGAIQLAVENPDLGLSNSISFKVLIKDPLVINEYLADPPDTLAGDANNDGTRSSSADEFIELLNRSSEPFDISGYKLLDSDAIRHVFAAGTIVPPFEAAVVFGGGSPSGPFGNATENHLVFKASTGGLSLNNGGDTITLQDTQGRIVQQIKFGAVEGGADQSFNRDPDGDGSTFAPHVIVAADRRLFSPGVRADGDTFTVKPLLQSLDPPSVHVGSADITLSVSGARYMPGAVVLLNGTTLPTTFRSEALLEALVSSDLLHVAGLEDVQVKNPRGELSGIARFIIADDPPRLLRVNPQKTGTGAEDLEISMSGERFQSGATAMIEGTPIETRFVSPTDLIAIVPGTFFTRAAELSLLVVNEDTNQSNRLMFNVENGPLITRLSRNKIRSGIGAFEIEVGGVAFNPEVILYANNVALSTSYINDGSVTARIPAEMTEQPGLLSLQARNPDGGRSNIVRVRVQ